MSVEAFTLCPICSRLFPDKISFTAHYAQCARSGVVCNVCRTIYPSSDLLDLHYSTHPDLHVCDTCQEVFVNQAELDLHITLQHRFHCYVCNLNWSSLVELDHHRLTQLHEPQNHTCGHCEENLPTQQVLQQHSRKHQLRKADAEDVSYLVQVFQLIKRAEHPVRQVRTCCMCQSVFENGTALEKHMYRRHAQCSSCGLIFDNQDEAAQHRESHRNARRAESTSTGRTSPDPQKSFESGQQKAFCQPCKLMFTSDSKFNRHMREVHGNGCKPLAPGAGSSRPGPNSVENTNSMPEKLPKMLYKCAKCSLVYDNERDMRNHLDHHRDCETNFACELCMEEAENESELLRHISIAHDNYCRKCHEIFGNREHFNQHIKQKHASECVVC